jgi:hypothetical protein
MNNRELLDILSDEVIDEQFNETDLKDFETLSYRVGWNKAMQRVLVLICAKYKEADND